MPTGKLTTTDEVLRRVLPVVLPASSSNGTESPSHFTETVLVRHNNGHTEFLCMDGYRMHRVEILMPGVAKCEGQVVLGTKWLNWALVSLRSGEVVITDTVKRIPQEMSEEHDIKMTQEHFEATSVFDIGGSWPNPNVLIDNGDMDYGVGFRPQFLLDSLQAMTVWWESEAEENFPLIVHQMSKEKVSTFSLKNHIGRLRIDVMPMVYDEDDE